MPGRAVLRHSFTHQHLASLDHGQVRRHERRILVVDDRFRGVIKWKQQEEMSFDDDGEPRTGMNHSGRNRENQSVCAMGGGGVVVESEIKREVENTLRRRNVDMARGASMVWFRWQK